MMTKELETMRKSARQLDLAEALEQLVEQHGLKHVIGGLARHANQPPRQYYDWKVLATVARRLNKLYEYLDQQLKSSLPREQQD